MPRDNSIIPKKLTPVLDTKYVKVIAAKKEALKDAIVLICLDEDKYGHYDIASLRKMAVTIEQLEESGSYFATTRRMDISIYDKDEFKGKDLLITVGKDDNGTSEKMIEKAFQQSLPDVNSIEFVHKSADIRRK